MISINYCSNAWRCGASPGKDLNAKLDKNPPSCDSGLLDQKISIAMAKMTAAAPMTIGIKQPQQPPPLCGGGGLCPCNPP